MSGNLKDLLLELVDEGLKGGLKQKRICELLQISERRIQRWRHQEGQLNRRPAAKTAKPYNALTPLENKIVNGMLSSRELADASCRVLSVKTMERTGYYISPVTFWQRMKTKGINGARGIYAKRREKHNKPDTGTVTGPNQLWSWDITHLRTTTKYQYYYLYALLDTHTRKTVAWYVSDSLNSDCAQTLWDMGIINENLLDKDKTLPRSLSDRGSQMRSRSTKFFFNTLGVTQYFSRPRTPNDNPQIESLFSTVKNYPDYPGRFASLEEAQKYFDKFFNWYNNEHYHTSLGMITPADYHAGKAPEIKAERKRIRETTFLRRHQYNCLPKSATA
ncbi:MAG: IS3 family transposase [Desulfitobacteriaceae bacterium]|nr:IS3 family transposase [Desulfitobacteriaceae bacterium]